MGTVIMWAVIIICGVPIIFNAVRSLIKEHDITADVLVSIALIASVITGEYSEAAEVALIMTVGDLIEDFASGKARKEIRKLSDASSVQMTESAINDSPVVKRANRWAAILVVCSIVCAAAVGLITGDVMRGVTVLVVFCPCAFVLATPTAVSAAIGNLTKYGILIPSGSVLEKVSGMEVPARGLTKRDLARDPAFKNELMSEVRDAGVFLTEEGEEHIQYLFRIAKKTMSKITQNIVISLIINIVAVVLSASGTLTPAAAALVHNCGAVFVVINAATLLAAGDNQPEEA